MSPAALSQAYRAAREQAALIRRTHGLIVVSGRDRASYLQGLLTNDIVALQAGQGCYAAYLTAQGRMISDLHVHELGDVMLLVLPLSTRETVLTRLDQFIFSEDVQLGDVTDTFAALAVVGPAAGTLVAGVTGMSPDELTALPEHGAVRREIGGDTLIVRQVTDPGVPGFELIGQRDRIAAAAEALRQAGAPEADDPTADLLRIEAGVPLFGRDMDEETIPLEAGIEPRAISFTKGCYVGQEIIIRVLHRGHGRVARKLVGLTFDPRGDVPPPGSAVHAAEREVGTITSSAVSPTLARGIALAYLKRDAVEAGQPVTVAGDRTAQIVPLPFVIRA
ncbi:MAG: folate-binding protein YgfZ [Vicinamibacterales bacterium]